MSPIFTATFWKDALERVISTAAQAAIGAWGATAVIQDVDWRIIGGTAAAAAVLSLVKAVAASGTGRSDSASFVQ